MVQPHTYKVHYHADGSGRDSYVGVSSGGFFRPFESKAAAPVGSFRQRSAAWTTPAPVLHPMGVHYRGDGTGRDSYII